MLLEATGTEERLAKLIEVRPRRTQVLRLSEEIGRAALAGMRSNTP
jgi:uncharacterized protein HemY